MRATRAELPDIACHSPDAGRRPPPQRGGPPVRLYGVSLLPTGPSSVGELGASYGSAG